MEFHPVVNQVSGIFDACVPELLQEVEKYQLASAMVRGEQRALCPACGSPWSEREVLSMVKHGAGECMCNKWKFDLNAAAQKAKGV